MPWAWRAVAAVAALILLALGLWFWTVPDQPSPAPEISSRLTTKSLPTPVLLSVRPIELSLVSPARLSRPGAHSRRIASSRHAEVLRGTAHQDTPAAGMPPSNTPMAPAASLTPSTAEATLLELRLGQLASRTVQAYRVGEEALLPMSDFLTLAQLRGVVSPAGRVEGIVQPGDLKLVIDVQRDSATIGRRSVPVPRDLMIFSEGEVYLAASRLGELLGIQFAVSWPDLEVLVSDPAPCPLQFSTADSLRARP